MSIHVEDVPDDLIPGVDIQNLKKVDCFVFVRICDGRWVSVDLS